MPKSKSDKLSEEVIEQTPSEETDTTVLENEMAPETSNEESKDQVSKIDEPESGDKPKTGRWQKLKHWRPTKKQSLIGSACLVAILAITLIPFTRNTVFGLAFTTSTTVEAYDEVVVGNSQTARVQLTGLVIKIDGVVKANNATSPVSLPKLKPGKHTIEITKTNYKTISVANTLNLSFGKQKNNLSTKMVATGIPTSIKVTNYISGASVKGVEVSYKGSKATSNDKGEAFLILPIEKAKVYTISLKGSGYVDKTTELNIDNGQKVQTVAVVPAGKVYFLSKQSGRIDVVKTNLDGSDRSVVVAGTGKENDRTITMISTTDWKYLALSTKREDKKTQLILINTSDDSQTTMDEGNATFSLVGWDGKKLVYQSENQDIPLYKTGRYKIKSYDAEAKKITVHHQSPGSGDSDYNYSTELFNDVRIVNHRVLFTTSPSGNVYGGTSSVYSANIASAVKKKLFSYTDGYITLTYTSADEAYYTYSTYQDQSNKVVYFEVNEAGNWETAAAPENTEQYTYFVSPSNDKLLWSEPRDGKQTVLVGDSQAKNTTKLYSLSELKPYAWFTDTYALYSKKDSELYIASLKEGSEPKKIADYHRPSDIIFRGYGGGGGGPY